MQGQFITFEGTEGVGKTTAIMGLCQLLEQKGIGYIKTREPGGSVFAESLRQCLLDPATQLSADTELLAIFAARSDHLYQVILPALAEGKWVVCDRFLDSTVAYQGYGRWYGEKTALDKIDLLTQAFIPKQPDATLWLDLDIALGMERADRRGAYDRFEQEGRAFFERVYDGFAKQYASYPNRIHRINAQGSSDEVLFAVKSVLGL